MTIKEQIKDLLNKDGFSNTVTFRNSDNYPVKLSSSVENRLLTINVSGELVTKEKTLVLYKEELVDLIEFLILSGRGIND